MKEWLQQQVEVAIQRLQQQQQLPADLAIEIQIERARDDKNGDFACNTALMLAKAAKSKPRDIAALIVAELPSSELIAKVEIAGPGFINFFLTDNALQHVVNEILAARSAFGCSKTHADTRVHVEYASSNPTGPLHVGHGRSAAFGASLANILEAVGFDVHREYYVNDAGRQMNILAVSVWLRYLELNGETFNFPTNGYKGEYVKAIAAQLQTEFGDRFIHTLDVVYSNVPADAKAGADEASNKQAKEAHIDALIHNAQQLLGENYQTIFSLALTSILDDIREDLSEYRVTYDEWFSEQCLVDAGAIEHAVQVLQEKDYLYEQEGALWFKSIAFGDDKDRVVRRANGQYTYFASDITYHLNKLERGYDHLINILGADHHGYVPRLRAAIEAFSGQPNVLTVPLIQFVSLYRDQEKVPMSTRGGEFVTLRDLRNEVGDDAARFFYLLRKANQHMDFDLELAKSKSNDNPVYYIQYAHARICSVLRQLKEKNIDWHAGAGVEHLSLLTANSERNLLKFLSRYPEIIETAARDYEPHVVVQYLRELATAFHSYYNSQQFIVDDIALRQARLNLIVAIKQVLANALALLGVLAPEEM